MNYWNNGNQNLWNCVGFAAFHGHDWNNRSYSRIVWIVIIMIDSDSLEKTALAKSNGKENGSSYQIHSIYYPPLHFPLL